MIRITLIGLLLGFLSLCGVNALHAQAGGASTQPPAGTAQATYQSTVQPGQVVDVIRAARPKLEEANCCNYSLGFLVSRYQQGQLQIVGLGTWDGKNWFRVSFGGGDAILAVDDIL